MSGRSHLSQIRTVLLLAAVAVAGGCRQAERTGKTETPQGCADCHQDIACQWQNSPHAAAWVSPEFSEQTGGHTDEACLPCHAPSPLLDQSPGSEPQLRNYQRNFGVDCKSCHLVGCAYAGPYRTLGPHRMEQDTTRLPCSSFCGTCHRVELDEYVGLYLASLPAGQHAMSCNDCHMPAYVDRLTQGHVLSYIHPKRTVRDHSFFTWSERMIRETIVPGRPVVRITEAGTPEVAFTLTNRGAAHRIPTGEFGYRELVIRVELLDPEGRVVGRREKSLFCGQEEGLEPFQETPFTWQIRGDDAARAVSVRLAVERVNEDRSFRVPFVDQTWPIGED